MAQITFKRIDKTLAASNTTIVGLTGLILAVGTLITSITDTIKKIPNLPLTLLWLTALSLICFGFLIIWPRTSTGSEKSVTPLKNKILGCLIILVTPILAWFIYQQVIRPPLIIQSQIDQSLESAQFNLNQGDRKQADDALKQALMLAPKDDRVQKLYQRIHTLSLNEQKLETDYKHFAQGSMNDKAWDHAIDQLNKAEKINPWDNEIKQLRDECNSHKKENF